LTNSAKVTQFAAVVPAAGVGKRMQADCPKQYMQLNGKTVLEHTVLRLLLHPQITRVVIALGAEDEYFDSTSLATHPDVYTVIGGEERSDSVLAGLKALSADEFPWVLVHDAARPCVRHSDISKLINSCLKKNIGGLLATPVRDTMKRTLLSGEIRCTESRENLWHAQTPQMYPLMQLRDALSRGIKQGIAITDESSAIEWCGLPSFVITGGDDNIKITRPNDLKLAAFYLTEQNK
jgi:2-C-methyl-D-erythritol 4-phosphate cytidylyltransferase